MPFITSNRTVNKFNLDLHLYIWHECHEMSHMWQHANNIWLTNIPFIDIFSLSLLVLRFIILEPVNLIQSILTTVLMSLSLQPIKCLKPWVNVNTNKTERVHRIFFCVRILSRFTLMRLTLECGDPDKTDQIVFWNQHT